MEWKGLFGAKIGRRRAERVEIRGGKEGRMI
jgi:hypothetical protein